MKLLRGSFAKAPNFAKFSVTVYPLMETYFKSELNTVRVTLLNLIKRKHLRDYEYQQKKVLESVKDSI